LRLHKDGSDAPNVAKPNLNSEADRTFCGGAEVVSKPDNNQQLDDVEPVVTM
jgi:hypothetical protein